MVNKRFASPDSASTWRGETLANRVDVWLGIAVFPDLSGPKSLHHPKDAKCKMFISHFFNLKCHNLNIRTCQPLAYQLWCGNKLQQIAAMAPLPRAIPGCSATAPGAAYLSPLRWWTAVRRCPCATRWWTCRWNWKPGDVRWKLQDVESQSLKENTLEISWIFVWFCMYLCEIYNLKVLYDCHSVPTANRAARNCASAVNITWVGEDEFPVSAPR